MANRRMFSLDVVDTDRFLEMPASSQNLYFHLGMRADDDGFVSSPKKITKLVNCGEDDLNVLISKGFVIAFDGGIVVIRHWKQNNYIQSDRYKQTLYKKELSALTVNNGAYEIDMYTPCIQSVSKMEAQYSIEIDNNILCAPDGAQESEKTEKRTPELDKKAALQQDTEDFEEIYKIYPKKKGKAKAFEYYRGFVGKGRMLGGTRYRLNRREIYLAVDAYVREKEEAGTDLQFYQDFSTFMNKTILDYLPEKEDQI